MTKAKLAPKTAAKTVPARKAAAPSAAKPTGQKAAPDAKKTEPASSPTVAATGSALRGKIGALITLLGRPDGATIFEMMEATGWQQHSVRGALTGQIKKKLGFQVTSDKPGNERIYRIAAAAPPAAKPASRRKAAA